MNCCGFAVAQCGEALPHRHDSDFFVRGQTSQRGLASVLVSALAGKAKPPAKAGQRWFGHAYTLKSCSGARLIRWRTRSYET